MHCKGFVDVQGRFRARSGGNRKPGVITLGQLTLSMLPDGIPVHIILLTMYGTDAYPPASEKGPYRTLNAPRIDL
jgi:hypothetical protein